MDADVIVVGAGLAGLVAAAELVDAGRKVILLDQEGEQSLGGQAFWSFGGLFLVDSPEQRRLGIRDSHDLALAGLAGLGRLRPRRGRLAANAGPRPTSPSPPARSAHGCTRKGVRWFPDRRLGRARRLYRHRARQLGAALSRHLGHGTGRARAVRAPRARGRASGPRDAALSPSRQRADHARPAWSTACAATSSSRARSSAASQARARWLATSRCKAQAVIVTSGGIGGNHDLVRRAGRSVWASRPARMICGVPEHVDGRMLAIAEAAGGNVINRDRMWHYTEGIAELEPDLAAGTASASCRGRRRSGSTRAASGCRCRSFPASIRSARSSTSWRPATTTPGSC